MSSSTSGTLDEYAASRARLAEAWRRATLPTPDNGVVRHRYRWWHRPGRRTR